jgi:hypothetical protein
MWGRLRHSIVLPVVLVGGLALAFSAPAAKEPKRPTACGPVPVGSEAASKLRVVGNHMEDSDGHVVVPYGISLVGGPETKYWGITEKAAVAQIVASKRYWHANAVRVQVGEAQLLDFPTPGHSFNVPFANSVNRLVCRVLRQGQIPIINDTTLFTARSRGPTGRSVRFWQFMSRRYGNRFPVIFDLFDEPRLGRNPRTNHFNSPSRVWKLWERGGSIAGKPYVGMQRLVDTVRIKEHADNVIWMEEPWYLDADKLLTAELPTHLLRGKDIVYAFHKATLTEGSRSWRGLDAVAAKGIPMVDSEWSQFAATNRPWECQDDSYAGVPRFLTFLHQANIGIIAWSLQPGSLIKGTQGVDTVHDGNDFRFTENPDALATPNSMQPDYGCDSKSLGQGAGALIQDYFARYSSPASAALFPRFD